MISCEQCPKESRVNNRQTLPHLQIPGEHNTGPEDTVQIDLVPELRTSIGHENIVTAKDLISRYLFAYATTNQVAETINRVIFNLMTRQAYTPMTIIADKGSACVSHLKREATEVLEITLQHATTQQAPTIGRLERKHASLKKAFSYKTRQHG